MSAVVSVIRHATLSFPRSPGSTSSACSAVTSVAFAAPKIFLAKSSVMFTKLIVALVLLETSLAEN